MQRTQIGESVVAALLTITLMLDFVWKGPGDFQEYMWACYWASVAMVVGIAWSEHFLIDSAGLFFVSVGTPSWLLGIILANRRADATSYLMHLLPIGSAYLELRKARTLSFRSVVGAWGLFSIPFSLTSVVCDPIRNINLVGGVWLSHIRIPESNAYHVVLLATTLIWMWGFQSWINRLMKHRQHPASGKSKYVKIGQNLSGDEDPVRRGTEQTDREQSPR